MKKIEQEEKSKQVEGFGFFFGNGVTYGCRDDGLCLEKSPSRADDTVNGDDIKQKTAEQTDRRL